MISLLPKKPTFLFYDYETFGVHTFLDRPAQFACVRTDMDLNIIGIPECFYCRIVDDYLPDPHAVLITKITPQYTEKHGIDEHNFSKKIFNIFKEPYTCIIGYNNIYFDDEITRNMFYRNFFDPYEWSWKNGNSRWDILPLLRACYALRPTGIKWPKNNLGLVSFKLEDLTEINNIHHTKTHDAMSDVYATIAMARLIKKNHPKLFDFFFYNRKKNHLYKLVNCESYIPMIYISSFFGAARYNATCILPIIWHKHNKNILIAIDLSKDIEKLIVLCNTSSVDEEYAKILLISGVILLYFNRCPILAPMQVLTSKDLKRLKFDMVLYQKNIMLLKKNLHVYKIIQNIFSQQTNIKKSSNVDVQLYNAFFDCHDKKIITSIRNTKPSLLKNIDCNFHDMRLKQLLFRYRARNFFYSLNQDEKKIWYKHCLNCFEPIIFNQYISTIQDMLIQQNVDKKKSELLKSVLTYALKKYKTLFYLHFNVH
ncbi:exodeoxyribonuclease I [Buchnera aphidicola (Hyadaphis tataricae)]|uniref:Exodeoxyribonuclease I n=1 Tax=Buchnera aphidicola (Hyadaphis tataricae) TaxID=1241859 RepID=A0A4D6Y682_9GAMM|nr:exodeoxyribonuclease I [Buchnera aphidicola]QCI21828.1 exodeoxyribonuclease I [Buchnera aphidicola (Hyadaphis tataricae)]